MASSISSLSIGSQSVLTGIEATLSISPKMRNLIEKILLGAVTELDLPCQELNDDDITALAWAITSPDCNLLTLNLTGNQIDDIGASRIAWALQSPHCKLHTLRLMSNEIGDSGAVMIAEALESPHCTLTHLYLSLNQIRNLGGKRIAEAFKSPHCKLRVLNLAKNKIDLSAVIDILERVVQLEECILDQIDLSESVVNNEVDDLSATKIATVITSPKFTLAHLNLLGLQLTQEGLRLIIEALRENETLRDLGLSGLSGDAQDEVKFLLERNRSNHECKKTDLFSLLLYRV